MSCCPPHAMSWSGTRPTPSRSTTDGWKARLRPMRGLHKLRSVHVISTGPAFVQNLRRGHYELGVDVHPRHRILAAFAELTPAI
jgi:hypothetical protein